MIVNNMEFNFWPTQKIFWRCLFIAIPVSICIGLLVAFFLVLLEFATNLRLQFNWLIFFLPFAGVLIYFLYNKFGEKASQGNNLIINEANNPSDGVPIVMVPLIFCTTIITHLFGGSAGREGTAVQMGGSISSLFAKWFKITTQENQVLLMCGIAAGFGAVFGTPIAGAIFALEVLVIGKIKFNALVHCILASFIGHLVCLATGVMHTHYIIKHLPNIASVTPYLHLDFFMIVKVILAGIIFGLVSRSFVSTAGFLKRISNRFISKPWLIPVIASILIICISYLLGTFDFLGLGVTTLNPNGTSIVKAFTSEHIGYLDWFWKLLLTAITLSMGFKGGEVTPLFFIGATLGNTLAILSGSPIDLFAGIGFVALFAAATNTPIACAIMAIELFGVEYTIYFVVACLMAYYFSGKRGIYEAQLRVV